MADQTKQPNQAPKPQTGGETKPGDPRTGGDGDRDGKTGETKPTQQPNR